MIDSEFHNGWSAFMMEVMKGEKCVNCREIMQECAEYHYRVNDMDSMLEKYVGDLEGFLTFLVDAWGWIITCDKEKGVIVADENKAGCVCPVAHDIGSDVTDTLCYCSEGFAKRMFEKVTRKKVKAAVIRSVLRGDKTCVYEIHL